MNALKMVHMDSKVSPVSGFLGFCALAHLSFSVTKLITTKLLEKKTKKKKHAEMSQESFYPPNIQRVVSVQWV